MTPTFIGIGAPKAGTTWLFRCLQEHPAVFMTPMKETDFFASYNYEERPLGADDLRRYASYFAGGEHAGAVGEITVRYLTDPEVPARVHEHLPEVQLVVSLRNPVEQVYSHYWHLNRQNFHQWYAAPSDGRLTFEQALAKYPDKLTEPAFYHAHLQRWLAHFPREKLHVILYDDIVDAPGRVLTDLYAFLGVDPAFQPAEEEQSDGTQVRQGTSPRHPALHQVYLRTYAWLSRSVYVPLKKAVGVDRATRVAQALRVREVMETVFRRKGYPTMKPATRRALQAEFREDVEQLQTLVGRDLSAWLT